MCPAACFTARSYPPLAPHLSSPYCSASGSSPTVAVFRLVTPTPAAQVTRAEHHHMGAFWVTYQGTPTQGADATAEYVGNY